MSQQSKRLGSRPSELLSVGQQAGVHGATIATDAWLGGGHADMLGGSSAAPLVTSLHSFPQPITTCRALSELVVKAAGTQRVFTNRQSCGERSEEEEQESNPIHTFFSKLTGTEVSISTKYLLESSFHVCCITSAAYHSSVYRFFCPER